MTQAIDRKNETLLLTGAAGTLGKALRAPLADVCARLRLSDRLGLGAMAAHEEDRPCDLADRAAVLRLMHGVGAVVHLGGVSVESPFEQIGPSNLNGVFNIYEAARLCGTRRIVFASSNHVTGGYPQGQMLTPKDPPWPDGYYGASKLFGESMAQMYWDRYGIESVCLRIGSATPEPIDRRALSTWLSLPDLERLVKAALGAPEVGYLVTYGISDNPARWWSKDGWDRLGYTPHDSSEAWREAVQDLTQAAGSPMARLQGGIFHGMGPFDAPSEAAS